LQWAIGKGQKPVYRCLLSIAYCPFFKKGQSANVKECEADFLRKWDK
jgi:hypothetical protein